MVYFNQEVSGVAKGGSLRVCCLSFTIIVSVKAGAHKLFFTCMGNTVLTFVSA